MGRQLPLAVTANDAVTLVNFIHQQASCRLSVCHATSPDDIWLDGWGPDLFGDAFTVYIWPTPFPWQPVFAQTCGPKCPPNNRGLLYVSNVGGAPIIEFSGNNLVANRVTPDEVCPPDQPRCVLYGRIYWAKDFVHEIQYDAAAFSDLVDRIWRWIRKMAKKRPGRRDDSSFFPEAWQQVTSAESS